LWSVVVIQDVQPVGRGRTALVMICGLGALRPA
jgi:hypothetical protein